MKKNVIIIPCLEPTYSLVGYIDELINSGFNQIVVINDGSSEAYDEIFNEIKCKKACHLISYPDNHGKGYALKCGYQYIEDNLPNAKGIITVDSDGQHSIKDVCHIDDCLNQLVNSNTLILGARNFNLPHIPFKSRLGNRVTSLVTLLLSGRWLQDTQTGLRGFDIHLLSTMINISGDRFEYEMNVLNDCLKNKVDIVNVAIDTIYENNNESTHYKTIGDSLLIGKAIFGQFFKFMSSSLVSTIVDLMIAWFLFDQLRGVISEDLFRIACATITARLISMSVNYLMNKHAVFKDNETNDKSWMRYILLCIVIMMLSTILVYLIHCLFRFDEKFIKVMVDMSLFVISYKVQKQWVFN